VFGVKRFAAAQDFNPHHYSRKVSSKR
jgi:hypothetical protein